MSSVDSKVRSRIHGKGRGGCFTPGTFRDLGSPEAVRLALFRLERKGTIRRLARGLYDCPRTHPEIGPLSPAPEAIAKALAARDAARLQPSGAYAANRLGLSEQIPATIVFLTDGPSQRIRIWRHETVLKSTTPKRMKPAGRISGTGFQALRHIGKTELSDRHVRHLVRTLSPEEKKQLWKDRIYAPGWLHPFIEVIAGEAP